MMQYFSMFFPFIKAGLDLLLKWKIINEEQKKKFFDELSKYDSMPTPAKSQDAYKEVLKKIDENNKL